MEVHVFFELVVILLMTDDNLQMSCAVQSYNSTTTGRIDLVVVVINKGCYYIKILELQ